MAVLNPHNTRMQWVDAMRGFSMILVVFSHVSGGMGQTIDDSILCSIFQSFRMPLFFFVSGFFSFRFIDWWKGKHIKEILSRKIKAQIIGLIFFASCYKLFVDGYIDLSNGFGRYWFTIVLFQMYLLYVTLSVISKKLKVDIVIPVLIALSVILFGLLNIYKDSTSWAWNFFNWIHLCHYLQFFTLGIICATYKNKFMKVLDNNLFTTIMIIGWIFCQYLNAHQYLIEPIPLGRVIICRCLMRYFALMTVISCFFGAKEYFAKDSFGSDSLKAIGRRTLDIYYIHYFLIPDLLFIKPWFAGNRMIIVQLFTTLAVTIAIIAVCMLISAMLRRSKLLAVWLFGEKIKSQISIKPSVQPF